MQILIDTSDAKKLMKTLSDQSRPILVKAINATLTGVRTDITTEITAEVNLPKSFLTKTTGKASERTFYIYKASAAQARPSGTISTRGANVPLINYMDPRTTAAFKLKPRTRVKKSSPKTIWKYGIIATMSSGHRGLFTPIIPRVKSPITGKSRIRQRYGPRVPDILSNEPVMARVQSKAGERLLKKTTSLIDYYLTKP